MRGREGGEVFFSIKRFVCAFPECVERMRE